MSLIYVSSPYQDLIDQRAAVFEAIKRLEHEPLGMESYSAEETRPIDKCLADVRRCQAYVGLVAWRYGSKPPGLTKSFTHLEYEEAGRLGIQRFMFLASDSWPATHRDKQRDAVVGFRQSLRDAHVCKEFSSLDELKYEVATALRTLGVSVRIPPLLPYKCDRREHYDDLTAGLNPAPPSPPLISNGLPIVWVAHGSDQQAVGKFAECIRDEASSLLSAPQEQAVPWRELPWPCEQSIPAFKASFLRRLCKALDLAATDAPEKIAARIDELGAPLVVHSRVLTDEWLTESPAMLAAACMLWSTLPLRLPSWAPVLFLTIEYREETRRLRRYFVDRRNRAIRESLVCSLEEALPRDRWILIRELDDVKRLHVEEWTDSQVVRTLVRDDDLTDAIAELFGSSIAMPMRPLARELMALLKARTGTALR